MNPKNKNRKLEPVRGNNAGGGGIRPCKPTPEQAVYEQLTPYQGSKRTFGYFKCGQCKKSWMSANSWANKGQQCKTCYINVYPHQQRPLKGGKNRNRCDPKKEHMQELCEQCRHLGMNCKKLNRVKRGKRRHRRRRA